MPQESIREIFIDISAGGGYARSKTMDLKNYQEDLVLHVAKIVLEDRPDVKQSEGLLFDVAAYALNRLPPRYILSERGFTRLAADHYIEGDNGDGLAGLVEVLLLVNKAVDTITGRRKPSDRAGRQEEAAPLGYWHNLPYLIGRVADHGRAVVGASVTLYVNDKLAAPASEAGWTNPYVTNAATRGFYSFLPKSARSRSKTRRFRLRLTFQHPDYREASLERALQTEGEFAELGRIDSEHILNLGTLNLRPRSR
jgi:competence protein ComFB